MLLLPLDTASMPPAEHLETWHGKFPAMVPFAVTKILPLADVRVMACPSPLLNTPPRPIVTLRGASAVLARMPGPAVPVTKPEPVLIPTAPEPVVLAITPAAPLIAPVPVAIDMLPPRLSAKNAASVLAVLTMLPLPK